MAERIAACSELLKSGIAGVLARGQIKQGKGDAWGAIADYDAVLNKAPNNLAALRARAGVLIAIKDYAKGAADYDRLIELEPGEAQNYYQRGLIYEHAGALDKASADYKTALARKADFADAQSALARVTEVVRQRKTAEEHARKPPVTSERQASVRRRDDRPASAEAALPPPMIPMPAPAKAWRRVSPRHRPSRHPPSPKRAGMTSIRLRNTRRARRTSATRPMTTRPPRASTQAVLPRFGPTNTGAGSARAKSANSSG